MNERLRVLLVEDDNQIPRVLKHPLAAAGFDMLLAETVDAGLAAVAEEKPDLVLVDLGLGERDGKDLIAAVREWSDVPIIVLSARDAEEEKVAALDLGADDYVNKPFGVQELFARMRNALRRRSRRHLGQSNMKLGLLSIDFAGRRVTVGDAAVMLTRLEYNVLRVLAQHAGQVVTHRQLLEAAWGGASARDSQHVRVVVGQLRRKLEVTQDSAPLILTEQGVGYRMRADDETPSQAGAGGLDDAR